MVPVIGNRTGQLLREQQLFRRIEQLHKRRKLAFILRKLRLAEHHEFDVLFQVVKHQVTGLDLIGRRKPADSG